MQKTLKILIYDPNPNDGAGFCRTSIPFNSLRKFGVEISFTNDPSWAQIQANDLLFLHRPIEDKLIGAMEMAYLFGKPVWTDFSDNYREVTPDHPMYRQIRAKIELMDKITAASTVFTVHQETMLETFPKAIVIPHGIPDEFLKWRKAPKFPKKKVICWRGSDTHTGSITQYASQLVKLSNEFPEWQWKFIGYTPWQLSEIKYQSSLPFIPAPAFWHKLSNESPAILVVLHADNQFAKDRGTEAGDEAAFAGSTLIAPNWDHWKIPGSINYTPNGDITEAIRKAIHEAEMEPMRHQERIDRAWSHAQQNLVSIQNEKRIEILMKLCPWWSPKKD